MELTASTTTNTGSPVIGFNLPNTNPILTASRFSLKDVAANHALLIAFICNHCPYVIHIRDCLAELAREYQGRELCVVAISSNDIDNYPADGPDKMSDTAFSCDFCFPYLYDESQEIARAYGVVCTPDFFLFDRNKQLVYHGQFDSSRPRNKVPVSGEDIRRAVDAVLSGRTVAVEQIASVGCSIKWKPGKEPN